MFEKLKQTHRERLVAASIRSHFFRNPSSKELIEATELLKNGMDFRTFLIQLKQSNEVAHFAQMNLKAQMRDVGSDSIDLCIVEQLSPKTRDIYMQLQSAIHHHQLGNKA